MTTELLFGDCLDALRDLADASVDAVVTDPPYGISFMGNHWDRFDIEQRVGKRDVSQLGVRLTGGIESPNRKETARTASAFANAAGAAGGYDFSATGNRAFQAWVETWGAECLRVLKPGGHLLSFGGTRTYHRLAAGLEDAGFEIRDCLAWLFGSGFPKSHNLGGASAGWGTALKPAFEPIVMARKPLVGTVAANVLAHGTGAVNIDGTRIAGADGDGNWSGRDLGDGAWFIADQRDVEPGQPHDSGRWPANVVLDEEAAALLDEHTGELTSGANPTSRGGDKFRGVYGDFVGQEECTPARGADSGGASRFFYCAKVSRAERGAGLDGFDEHVGKRTMNGGDDSRGRPAPVNRNNHPTVKPIALMRWLVRLVTPPEGLVLDPFLGSGTTGIAAALEGFRFLGVEREAGYLEIAHARIAFWQKHGEDGLRICADRDNAGRKRAEVIEAGQLDLLAG